MEQVNSTPGFATAAVKHILSDGRIVMDEGGLIQTEWLQTASFSQAVEGSLKDWIADRQQEGKIELVRFRNDPHLRKKLIGFGMASRDPKYLMLASQARAYAVVTEDIGFFDPKMKASASATQNTIKDKRIGCVCKFARKQLGVEITTAAHAVAIIPNCI